MAEARVATLPLADVALVAEYPWRYGGSQRLLDILARAWNKPIYVLPPAPRTIVWNTPATIAVPDEPVLFSIVVDGLQPRLVPGRRHIKFCHSRSTIERYWHHPQLRAVEFLTHRPRVFDHYRRRGLSITRIPDGYIPYDTIQSVEPVDEPETACCVTSRLSPDKVPLTLVAALRDLPYPTYLVGSQEDVKHASEVRTTIGHSPHIRVVEPDQRGGGISEPLQAAYLRRSKILIHHATAGLKDHLEYSILDALVAGAVPVCITPDPAQFDRVETEAIGRVVPELELLPAAIGDALSNYEVYRAAAARFMSGFMSDQPAMLQRWRRTVETLVTSMMSETDCMNRGRRA